MQILIPGFVLAALVLLADWFGFLDDPLGQGYCSTRHPVEMTTSTRASTCNRQHVIQQQSGGGDSVNTVHINALEHD